MILKKIDKHVRKSANLGDWQIISPGVIDNYTFGYLEKVENLEDVMFKKYE